MPMNSAQITKQLGGQLHPNKQIGTASVLAKKSNVKSTISTQLRTMGFPATASDTVGTMYETAMREGTLMDGDIVVNEHLREFNKTSAEAMRILKMADSQEFTSKHPQLAELFDRVNNYLGDVVEKANPAITGVALPEKAVAAKPAEAEAVKAREERKEAAQAAVERTEEAAPMVRITEEKAPTEAPTVEGSRGMGEGGRGRQG
ncbi:MAG: hypothetical protein AB7F64_02080 [Gammaproteobacteria bacterium]